MVYEKLVSADYLKWPHAYCGNVKIHPNDTNVEQYVNSNTPLTSEPNQNGIDLVLVGCGSQHVTAHFRRKDAISSEYLDMVRKNIHNRVIDVVYRYIVENGNDALLEICNTDLEDFEYSKCYVEHNLKIGDLDYRPDIVVYQDQDFLPRIELEVIFTHDIERDRRGLLLRDGHLLLSMRIDSWVTNLAHQEKTDVSDNEILTYVKAKKFSHYIKKEKEQAKRIWREIQVVKEAENEFFNNVIGCDEIWKIKNICSNLIYIVDSNYSDQLTEKAKSILILFKERKAMLEIERAEKEKLAIHERDKKEREKKERMDKEARDQEQKRNKREMKLASLKQKHFTCR